MKNLNKDYRYKQRVAKTLLSLLFFLPIGLSTTSAQKMEVFRDTTEMGQPTHTGKDWTVYGKRLGVSLHLKYTESPAIQEPKMYIFIDKKTPLGDFIEFDTYKIEVPEGAVSIERFHHFKEVGDYAVSFTDADKQVVATDTLRLRYDQKLIFCEDVKRGQIINEMTEVEPSPTGLYYYTILLKGSRPLDTHQIIMHIYQHDGDGFNIHVGKYERYVEHSRNYAAFRGLFLDAGHYKVQAFKFNGEPYAESFLYLKPQKTSKDG